MKPFLEALDAIIGDRTGLAETAPESPIRDSLHNFIDSMNYAFYWEQSRQGHDFWSGLNTPNGNQGYSSDMMCFNNTLLKHPHAHVVHKDMIDLLLLIAKVRDSNRVNTEHFLDQIMARFFDTEYSASVYSEAINEGFEDVEVRFVKYYLIPSGIVDQQWLKAFEDLMFSNCRILMLLEASFFHNRFKKHNSTLNNSNPNIPNTMETILLTDGLRAGESVPAVEARELSSRLYMGQTEDAPPYCHISDETVVLCEYSEFADDVVLIKDAVETMDGYVDITEAVVVDYSDYLELPVLLSRLSDHNLVRDSLVYRRFICTESDEVVQAIINGSGSYGYMMRDDSIYCNDTDEYYVSTDVAEEHEVYYSDSHRCYVKRVRYVANYASLSDVFKTTSSTVVSFGVEVEKEDQDVLESAVFQDIYDTTGWAKEKDGSLDGDSGYEFVSPVYDLFDLSAFNKDLSISTIARHINADYSDSCGGHITVSVKGMTSEELIGGLKAFFPLLYSLYPERCSVDYSRAKSPIDLLISPTKYSAVYMKSDKLVEFRIFPAVQSVVDLKWRIELMQFMIRNYGASEKQVHKMMVQKGSRLNTLLRTYYRRNFHTELSRKILSLSLDYVNNVRSYNRLSINTPLASL